ncbi:MAG: Maf family protein [Vicinamibacterales bacterium]
MRLILASASPRRAALLREAGYAFTVEPAHADESECVGEAAPDYVLRVAALKARTVAARFPDDIVLAADTTVVVDGVMLAKPADDADAERMLRLLSGRAHEVLTGVVVIRAGVESSAVGVTRVRFRPLTPAEVAWYVASGEAHDKAGAYGVQGLAARFVESLEGSYTNVVGLPLSEVRRLLEEGGVAPVGPGRPAGGHAPEPFDRTGA